MFEKELSLIQEYISDLSKTPVFGSKDEARKISYRKFAAEEISEKLLEEELNLPSFIPDRMPLSAAEIVDDYISDAKKYMFNTSNSDVKLLFNEMILTGKAIFGLFENDGVGNRAEVYRCQDVFTGRYFYSNVERITEALNKTNGVLLEHGSVALNTYYANLGIDGIKIGYNFDWSYPDCQKISLILDNFATKDGIKCLYVDFNPYPKQNFEVWG